MPDGDGRPAPRRRSRPGDRVGACGSSSPARPASSAGPWSSTSGRVTTTSSASSGARPRPTTSPPGTRTPARLDRGLIGKSDAVVNLAAASNKGNPYSRRWADALLESRVTTTRVLAEAVAAAETPPAYVVGVGTSAYGDHGTGGRHRGVTRPRWRRPAGSRRAGLGGGRPPGVRGRRSRGPDAPGADRAPRQRADPAADPAVPALPRRPASARGGQYFPMVSLEDWKAAATFLAENDVPSGPYNVCCPTTPTHREFVEALAGQLHRRAPFVVPTKLLELAHGAALPRAHQLAPTSVPRPSCARASPSRTTTSPRSWRRPWPRGSGG